MSTVERYQPIDDTGKGGADFLPLHLPRGTVGVCDCKTDETVVTEPDGFQWSKPKEAPR